LGYPLHGGCPITYTNNIATLVSKSREIYCGLSHIGNKMEQTAHDMYSYFGSIAA
jgi:hypothetical protein